MTGLLLVVSIGFAILFCGKADAARDHFQSYVFAPGDPVQFALRSNSPKLDWRVEDYFGVEVGRGSSWVSNQQALIEPAITEPGYYELHFDRDDGARTIAFALIPPPEPGPSPFGVMTHFAKGWDRDVLPLVSRAGIRHIRDEQYWRRVEKTPGKYQFSLPFQAYISEARALGVEPLVALTFANPHYDDGLTPHSDSGLAGYANYATAVVDRYRDALAAVEIWNEYNGSFAKGPVLADRPLYYARMLERAYDSIKAKHPDLEVLGGAAVKVPLPWFEALFDHGALEHMDALVIHPYRRRPEGVGREINALHELVEVHNHGQRKPIWVTEFGRHDQRPGGRHRTASYLVRMATLLLSSGVERMYWYLLRDDRTGVSDFSSMGLLRDADSEYGRYAPAPAYAAYANLIRQFGGQAYVRREDTDPRTQIHRFETDEGPLTVAWSTEGQPKITLRTPSPIVVIDIMGKEREIRPYDGEIELTLSSTPVYVRGTVSAFREWRPDKLLADATLDFGLERRSGDWRYGHYDGDGVGSGDGKGALGPYTDDDFEPLVERRDRWGAFWGEPSYEAVRLASDSGHPDISSGKPVWAVRRWISPVRGTVHLNGLIGTNHRGDGTEVLILRDGVELWRRDVRGEQPSLETRYDLDVDVRPGTRLDFAVTPGSAGDINYDSTVFTASITVPVIADSGRDFSAQQGLHDWSYGYFDGDGQGEGDGETPFGSYTDDDFERAIFGPQQRDRFWRHEDLPWLKVTRTGAHPSTADGSAAWAVRRWIADRDGEFIISGHVSASRDQGDGSRARILVAGREIWTAELGGPTGARQSSYELEVTVDRGTPIDFVVDPGPGLNADYDAVAFSSQIRELHPVAGRDEE